MSAVGKTTVAKSIAKKFNLTYYSGGDALKDIATKKGYDPGGVDWWDTQKGMDFLKERSRNHSFDKEVDKMLIKKIKQGSVVITSYSLPWITNLGIKIWLKASPENRAKRMISRDKILYNQALDIIKKRDQKNKTLYSNLYGINFGDDFSCFDFVISSDNLGSQSVKKVAHTIVTEFVK